MMHDVTSNIICYHQHGLVYYFDLEDVGDEGVCLSSLLHFITGESAIPSMGLKHPIVVQYHPPLKTAVFLGAQACYSKIFLPVIHQTSEECFCSVHQVFEVWRT